MKTAEEVLKENGLEGMSRFHNINMEERDKDDVIEAMKDYAIEAIKEDRKNVAEHAEAYLKESQMTIQRVIAIVDKDSIINAPMIELK